MDDIIKSLAVGAAAGLVIFLGMWVITTFAIVKTVTVVLLGVFFAVATMWAAGDILRDLFK